MHASEFKTAIHPLLKAKGFKRSKGTWRLRQSESIAVLNVQKSQYDEKFFLNLGVYLRSLGELTSPTEYKCHVRRRMDPGDPNQVAADALAWFESLVTLEQARELILTAEEGLLVTRVLRDAVSHNLSLQRTSARAGR